MSDDVLFDDVLFDDGKAPDAMRTIGEVARALGIRQHVLRYWEEQFPMLRPVKRSGGRRYYRREDVSIVAAIDRLVHREGYTLRGARAVIENRATPAPRAPFEVERANGREELREIRNRLAAALTEA